MARIAQVCLKYHPVIGGVEVYVQEASRRLVYSYKHDVDVLTTDPSGKLPKEDLVDGITVKRFRSLTPYYLSPGLNRYLKENSPNYDIIHAHEYASFTTLYAARAKRENRFVFKPSYHGAGRTWLRSMLHKPYRYVGRKEIFGKADKIICDCNYEKNLVVRDFACDEAKIVILPPGIDIERFRNVMKRTDNHRTRTILYAGRLEKYKGVEYLVRVMPMLSHDVVLKIAGSGPHEGTLRKIARKLNVGDRVEFLEYVTREQLPQRYADADVFVTLSQLEAYGSTVAEALVAGTPCIVSNTSALQEWIDGRNCFGVDFPIDLRELSSLINNVIAQKPTELNRSRIHDWNYVVGELNKLYEEIL
jgi:glycosyltransferase involved in cell wall biosynthesis